MPLHGGVVLGVSLEVLEADLGEGVDLELVELGPGGYGGLGRRWLVLVDQAGEDFVVVHLFEAQGVADELDAWLDTGLSNGRPLKLVVMAIKPDVWFSVERISVGEMPREIPFAQAWFKVHAHPNIEFEQTLVGSLHEVRLCGDPPTLPDGDEGPDLRRALDWEAGTVPAGEFVVNAVGSVHQSFTEGDGALIVVLWSGCHANVRPEKCPSSNLLRPGAGWAD